MAAAAIFACAAWGQMTRSLAGTVADPSGAAIPAAKVSATQRAMGVKFETVTNSAGAYVFEDLPLGVYTLEFSAPSFRALRVEGIEIHEASAIRQDGRRAASAPVSLMPGLFLYGRETHNASRPCGRTGRP